MKATHRGTCQVCGAIQKLPNGVLAKHGYSVDWGEFHGVCWGAGYRPYEQATDAIQKAIDGAHERHTRMLGMIEVLRTEPVGDTAPFHRYVTSPLGRSHYSEEIVKLVPWGYDAARHPNRATDRTHFTMHFSDGKREQSTRYSLYGTLEEVVLKLRSQRIERIQSEADRTARYIKWQERRVADWILADLLPLEAGK